MNQFNRCSRCKQKYFEPGRLCPKCKKETYPPEIDGHPMDDYLKYVIVNTRGLERPIIFSNLIDHASVVPHETTAVSAGYVDINLGLETNQVFCFGKSTTLELFSRGTTDAEIILKEIKRPHV